MPEAITIVLENTLTTAFKKQEFIQKQALESVLENIDNILASIKTNGEEQQEDNDFFVTDRVHNTLMIDGNRGTGKTSFILSLLNTFLKNDEKYSSEISRLGIIDPTLLETKEHVFLNIIAMVKNTVESTLEKKAELQSSRHLEWQKCMRSLASGLKSLDGVGSNQLSDNMWNEATLIMERGLENVAGGQKLEKAFHHFIRESLKVLNRKAFILVFDDIDTSVDQGKDILEMLRKYLTTPQIITIMSGDLELYSTIVRQLQWEKLDKNGTLKNYESQNEVRWKGYRDQVTHLEDQYLTKVLRPENRIRLMSIDEFENKYIKIKFRDSDEPISLDEHLDQLFSAKLHINDGHYYLKMYRDLIKRQPLRTQIEFLKANKTVSEAQPNQKTYHASSLLNVFHTILSRDPGRHFSTVQDGKSFLNKLSIYLINNGISDERNLKLLSDYDEDDKNISNLYIHTTSTESLKVEDYITYFLRVGLTLSKFLENSEGYAGKERQLITHLALDQTEIDTIFAQKLVSLSNINSNTNKNPKLASFWGNISVSREELQSIGQKEGLNLLMTNVMSDKSASFNVLSIYKLLGAVADLLRYNDDFEGTLASAQIVSSFYQFGSRLAEPDTLNQSDHAAQEEHEIEEKFETSDELKKQIKEWLNKKNNIAAEMQQLSLADLAKVWIHYWDSLSDIDAKADKTRYHKLKYISIYLSAFLNSLYTICQEKKPGSYINDQRSPRDDVDFLKTKLERDNYQNQLTTAEKHGVPYGLPHIFTFFDYLYECPLLDPKIWQIEAEKQKPDNRHKENITTKSSSVRNYGKKPTFWKETFLKETLPLLESTADKPQNLRRIRDELKTRFNVMGFTTELIGKVLVQLGLRKA